MLKYVYDSEDEIPEGLKEHYQKHGDQWVLNCDGAAPASKVDEFRKNNIKLKQDLEKFEGIDPEKHAELLKKEKDFEASKADNKDKVDELVKKRTEEITADFEKRNGELETTVQEQRARLEKLQIDQGIVTAANELGVRKGADADIISRARSVWSLDEDGNPVALDANGDKLYGPTGEPIKMAEWVEKLSKEAEHLFEPNKGSGSSGGGGGGEGDSGPNPWKTETFNLTNQAKMMKEDPAKAKRMAAAAGKTLKI